MNVYGISTTSETVKAIVPFVILGLNKNQRGAKVGVNIMLIMGTGMPTDP